MDNVFNINPQDFDSATVQLYTPQSIVL